MHDACRFAVPVSHTYGTSRGTAELWRANLLREWVNIKQTAIGSNNREGISATTKRHIYIQSDYHRAEQQNIMESEVKSVNDFHHQGIQLCHPVDQKPYEPLSP